MHDDSLAPIYALNDMTLGMSILITVKVIEEIPLTLRDLIRLRVLQFGISSLKLATSTPTKRLMEWVPRLMENSCDMTIVIRVINNCIVSLSR